MTELMLLNGKPKATIIEKFNYTASVICPDLKKIDFPNLTSCMKYIEEQGWEVNVSHIRKKVV